MHVLHSYIAINLNNCNTYIVVYILVITVMFSQSLYGIYENHGPAQPELVLSNPSSSDINVTVTNTDGLATGE